MRILLIRHAEPDYSVDSLTEKGFRAGDNELLYLTIHIARVMKDN